MRGISHPLRSSCPGSGPGPGYNLCERDADAVDIRRPDRPNALLRSSAHHRAPGLRRHRRLGQVPHARRGDRMIQAPDLPALAALVVAILILTGAPITPIGSLGLLRLKTFYERVHAQTLGRTDERRLGRKGVRPRKS